MKQGQQTECGSLFVMVTKQNKCKFCALTDKGLALSELLTIRNSPLSSEKSSLESL